MKNQNLKIALFIMHRRTSVLVFAFVLLLFSSRAWAQEKEFIAGKLFDSSTNEPLVFANIRITDRALGVITNLDGSFRIPLRYNQYGDTIEISSMGYETKKIPIREFKKELNIIKLDPAIINLEEAVVRAKAKKRRLSARQIVRRAIGNIPKNYALNPFSTIGYYRDYQREKEGYVNLNEAILEVFDQGFDTSDSATTKVLLYRYRKNMNFKRDSISDRAYDYRNYKKFIPNAYLPHYGGNEYSILRVHDAIRNYRINTFSFVNDMQRDLFDNHSFSKGDDVYLDDDVLYSVKFRKREYPYYAEGLFYISKTDFAIHKMGYAVYNHSNKSSTNASEKRRTRNVVFKLSIEYQRRYGKMYLNYISFNNTFQVRKPPELLVKEIVIDPTKKSFDVHFTNELGERGVFNRRNYRFLFEGKRIKFDKILLLGNEIWLYPKMETPEDIGNFGRIYDLSRKTNRDPKLLQIQIKGISDIDGNRLNRWGVKDYNQFREFFVQELRPNRTAPKNGKFMKKFKPIFKDQPKSKPANFDDYWMNTPLQTN